MFKLYLPVLVKPFIINLQRYLSEPLETLTRCENF